MPPEVLSPELLGIALVAVAAGRALWRARRSRPAAAALPAAAAETPAAIARPARSLEAELSVGLRRTRLAWVERIDRLLRGRPALDAAALEEIEGILFGADIGVRTAQDLLQAAQKAGGPESVRAALEARALEILRSAGRLPPAATPTGPRVILVVGVNGSGKTTTIGKLAARQVAEGRRVLVAAGDTFRAAAIEQLAEWARRAGAELVAGAPGGDPAAVAFDAVRTACARGLDVVIVDTAGRLQTHAGLMDELAKIDRAIRKQLPEAPHEVLLVVDANTGQNAIRQAQEFSRATRVSGLVLAKLDGSAKGGVVLGIAQETGIPVRFVGVGERLEDLVDFEPEAFVRALFEAEGGGDGEALRAGA